MRKSQSLNFFRDYGATNTLTEDGEDDSNRHNDSSPRTTWSSTSSRESFERQKTAHS